MIGCQNVGHLCLREGGSGMAVHPRRWSEGDHPCVLYHLTTLSTPIEWERAIMCCT